MADLTGLLTVTTPIALIINSEEKTKNINLLKKKQKSQLSQLFIKLYFMSYFTYTLMLKAIFQNIIYIILKLMKPQRLPSLEFKQVMKQKITLSSVTTQIQLIHILQMVIKTGLTIKEKNNSFISSLSIQQLIKI